MAWEQRGPGHNEREADYRQPGNGVDPGRELLSSFVTNRNEVLRSRVRSNTQRMPPDSHQGKPEDFSFGVLFSGFAAFG